MRQLCSAHPVTGALLLSLMVYTVWHICSISTGGGYSSELPFPIRKYNDADQVNILELAPKDYKSLVDLRSFKFRNNSMGCKEKQLLLLVLVSSKPDHRWERQVIRRTWGVHRSDMRLFFLLGAVNNVQLKKALAFESKKYKDLIEGNFIDSYRNMTYKHVMGMKYAIYHCSQAKYILKTDDDMFVHMDNLMNFLVQDLSALGFRNLLFCNVRLCGPVMRRDSKWMVSFKEYSKAYFPPYCMGWFILYSQDVILKLYKECQKLKYFWIDDVFVTGFASVKARLELVSASSRVLLKEGRFIEDLEASNVSAADFIFSGPDLTMYEVIGLWNVITKGTRGRPKAMWH